MQFFTLPIRILILSTILSIAATLPTQPNTIALTAYRAQIAARNVIENRNAVSIATPSVLLRRAFWPGRPGFMGGNRLAYKEAQLEKKKKAAYEAYALEDEATKYYMRGDWSRQSMKDKGLIEWWVRNREEKFIKSWDKYQAAERSFQRAQEKAKKKAEKGKKKEEIISVSDPPDKGFKSRPPPPPHVTDPLPPPGPAAKPPPAHYAMKPPRPPKHRANKPPTTTTV